MGIFLFLFLFFWKILLYLQGERDFQKQKTKNKKKQFGTLKKPKVEPVNNFTAYIYISLSMSLSLSRSSSLSLSLYLSLSLSPLSVPQEPSSRPQLQWLKKSLEPKPFFMQCWARVRKLGRRKLRGYEGSCGMWDDFCDVLTGMPRLQPICGGSLVRFDKKSVITQRGFQGQTNRGNRTESLWEGNLPLRRSPRGSLFQNFFRGFLEIFRGLQTSSQRPSQSHISLSEAFAKALQSSLV